MSYRIDCPLGTYTYTHPRPYIADHLWVNMDPVETVRDFQHLAPNPPKPEPADGLEARAKEAVAKLPTYKDASDDRIRLLWAPTVEKAMVAFYRDEIARRQHAISSTWGMPDEPTPFEGWRENVADGTVVVVGEEVKPVPTDGLEARAREWAEAAVSHFNIKKWPDESVFWGNHLVAFAQSELALRTGTRGQGEVRG